LAHERYAISGRRLAMGDQHPIDRPGQNGLQSGRRRAAIEEARTLFAWSAWIRSANAVEPCNDTTPNP